MQKLEILVFIMAILLLLNVILDFFKRKKIKKLEDENEKLKDFIRRYENDKKS